MVSADDLDPVAAYVHDQVEAIFAHGGCLPEPTAVHQTRVAIRRLRSTLRVFGALLTLSDEERAVADAELRWFASLLGEVRDRQVQRDRFAAALQTLAAEELIGPVAPRIESSLRAEQRRGEEDVEQAVASERCQSLRHLLGTWRQHPPVGEVDDGALRKRARKAAKKADRRLVAACASDEGADLHPARKAAKRARYAGELLAPLGRGKKQRKRFKAIQVLLGDHQDAIVAQATLRRLVAALPAGENGFTFGLLHEREREAAERLRRKACKLARSGG
jgi:CHAD domain-containing protein